MCWGADIHSGADGHRASVKCAAVRRQLSTHGYIRSQDECDFRPRTKLLPNLCCATGWSAFAAARKGPGQPPECAAAGIPARERPFPSRTSHLPLVRVFKKQYGLSSCHGSVIFKRTRMQSSWSRGRGETLRTYTGLCSEMQPDALRRSSHMLHVTLPFNSVSCWHDRSRSLSSLLRKELQTHSSIQHVLVHVVTVNHVWRDRRLVRERIAIGGLHVFALRYLGVHVVGPRRLMRRVVLQVKKNAHQSRSVNTTTNILRDACAPTRAARGVQ